MRLAEWLLAAVFLSWWLLSVAFQLHPALRRRLYLPYELGLLSGYRFFAPTPRNPDTHIEVRTRTHAGDPTPWQPAFPPALRAWHTTLWNPRARTARARTFLAGRVVESVQHRGRGDVSGTRFYRRLLASCAAHHPSLFPLQFRILRGKDFDPQRQPSLVFQSDWHVEPQ